MAIVSYLFIGALCIAGLLNLFRMVSRAQSPAELRGCLLAGATLLLFAMALWARGAHQSVVALVAAALGAACALAWFRHIYKQSLHNTSM